jgi:hypothetical protein
MDASINGLAPMASKVKQWQNLEIWDDGTNLDVTPPTNNYTGFIVVILEADGPDRPVRRIPKNVAATYSSLWADMIRDTNVDEDLDVYLCLRPDVWEFIHQWFRLANKHNFAAHRWDLPHSVRLPGYQPVKDFFEGFADDHELLYRAGVYLGLELFVDQLVFVFLMSDVMIVQKKEMEEFVAPNPMQKINPDSKFDLLSDEGTFSRSARRNERAIVLQGVIVNPPE